MTRSVEIPEAAVDYLGRLWWKQYDTESPYQHAQSVAKTREAIEGLLPYLAPVGDGGLREALESGIVYALQCSRIGAQWPDEQIASAVLSGLDDQHPGWDRAQLTTFHRPTCGTTYGESCDGYCQPEPAVPQPAKARRHCTCEVGMGTYPGDHHERGCQLNPVEVSDDDVEVAAQQADEWREGLPAPIGSAVPQPVDREAWRERIENVLRGFGMQVIVERGIEDSAVSGAADAVLAVLAGEQEQVGDPHHWSDGSEVDPAELDAQAGGERS